MRPRSADRLDPRLRRLVEELLAVLREKRVTMAEAEHRAGMSKKYLSKLVHGHLDLKVKHVYDILDALEVPHEEFWTRLAPRPRSLVRADLTMEELTEHVEAIVQRALKGRGGGGGDKGWSKE